MLQFILMWLISATSGQVCNCGRYYEQPAARIYKGIEAIAGRFPWQMLIEVWHISNGVAVHRTYGGVLISTRHVVTCASCLDVFFIGGFVTLYTDQIIYISSI